MELAGIDDLLRLADCEDTPACRAVGREGVDFERDYGSSNCDGQLGTRKRAKQDGLLIEREVHGEDHGKSRDAQSDPADRNLGK